MSAGVEDSSGIDLAAGPRLKDPGAGRGRMVVVGPLPRCKVKEQGQKRHVYIEGVGAGGWH